VKLPAGAALSCVLLSGCSGLFHSTREPDQTYYLRAPGGAPAATATATAAAPGRRASLRVEQPVASPGLESSHIMLVQADHRMNFYAHSRWPGTAPQLIGALAVEGKRFEWNTNDRLRRALELDANFAEAHGNWGGHLWRQGDLAGAKRSCLRAIELNPNLPGAHGNLGHVLFDEGDYRGALDAYDQSLALKPDAVTKATTSSPRRWNRGDLINAFDACHRALVEPDPQREIPLRQPCPQPPLAQRRPQFLIIGQDATPHAGEPGPRGP